MEIQVMETRKNRFEELFHPLILFIRPLLPFYYNLLKSRDHQNLQIPGAFTYNYILKL